MFFIRAKIEIYPVEYYLCAIFKPDGFQGFLHNNEITAIVHAGRLASVAVVGIYSFYAAREAIIKRTMDQLISVRLSRNSKSNIFLLKRSGTWNFLPAAMT